MTENTQEMTLVLGGTGKTGRRVVERLKAMGLPVRAGSRSADPAFDWDDQSTWAPALRGVDKVYVNYYPDLAFPGAAEAIRAFTDVAVRSGVRRLVLLSGRGEEEAQRQERTVQESGVEWTIVRSSWFSQNYSEHFLLEPVLAGVIALPAGNVAEPFTDVDDIADVSVAALTEDRHVGQVYELTGPRALTFAEAAAEISKATGRDIRYVPVSPEEFVVGATQQGVTEEDARMLADLFSQVLDGRNESVTDGIQRALGRAPKDFADYVRETAATGIWTR